MNTEERHHRSRIVASLLREEQVRTPFLLFEESELDASLGRFRQYLPGVRLIYATKANPSPAIIAFLAQRGLSFDVASAGELELVSRYGIAGENLYLSTPMKTTETIDAMFRRGVGACAVDTVGEVERIAAYRAANRFAGAPQLFIRIRVESIQVTVDLNTKFGCSIVEAIEIAQRAYDLGLSIGGICFHVGTQSTSADNYHLGVRSAMLVAEETRRRTGVRIPVINIGGGFCDPVAAERAHVDLDAYYQDVGAAAQQAIDAGYEVYAEPGRALVASAGVLVTSVIGTNIRGGHRWLYLDDGIYGCYSIKLYEHPSFEFYPLMAVGPGTVGPGSVVHGNLHGSEECHWTVAGPTCDSLDVVAESVQLPMSLQSGDVLLSPNLGAYSISTASGFNGFRAPECVVVRATTRQSGRLQVEVVTEPAMAVVPRRSRVRRRSAA